MCVNAPTNGAFLWVDPLWIIHKRPGETMLKKLLVVLIAAAFTAGAYAQAPKSDAAKPATPSAQTEKKADAKAGTKTEKKSKAKAKATKGKAKAKADEKKDTSKTSK
ncbi:MAG TPA: hypothetical protein VN929_08855 [Burkholderiales bacterium]|nr:hypothetical protein [Burkholderiales bacterium]